MQRDLVRVVRREDGDRSSREAARGKPDCRGVEEMRLDDVGSLASQPTRKADHRSRIGGAFLRPERERAEAHARGRFVQRSRRAQRADAHLEPLSIGVPSDQVEVGMRTCIRDEVDDSRGSRHRRLAFHGREGP